MATITCEDCSAVRHRTPSNTRYCAECRLRRNAEFFANQTRKCAHCEDAFPPINNSDRYCGACELGNSAYMGRCNYCGHDDTYRVHKDVAVCHRCARDPQRRRHLIIGLRKRLKERHNTTTQEHSNT